VEGHYSESNQNCIIIHPNNNIVALVLSLPATVIVAFYNMIVLDSGFIVFAEKYLSISLKKKKKN